MESPKLCYIIRSGHLLLNTTFSVFMGFLFVGVYQMFVTTIPLLMSRTIGRTPFKWEKGRGDKCCPGPESCLPCARPVLGASVSEWHIRPWDGCHGAQRQGGVYLCQAPGGMVARGSGCVHRFSPKLGNPGIASVWDWRVVASNTYPPNHLLLQTTTRMWLQELFVFNCRCTG